MPKKTANGKEDAVEPVTLLLRVTGCRGLIVTPVELVARTRDATRVKSRLESSKYNV